SDVDLPGSQIATCVEKKIATTKGGQCLCVVSGGCGHRSRECYRQIGDVTARFYRNVATGKRAYARRKQVRQKTDLGDSSNLTCPPQLIGSAKIFRIAPDPRASGTVRLGTEIAAEILLGKLIPASKHVATSFHRNLAAVVGKDRRCIRIAELSRKKARIIDV